MIYAGDMRRRTALRTLAGGCFLCASGVSAASAQELPRYCAVDPQIDLTRFRARGSTGNTRLDRVLIHEFRNIMRTIPVNPGFRIIDDVSGPNAFAINNTVIKNTQGTVLFGINLLRSQLNHQGGGYAIAGVAAHECAHIYQFFTSYAEILTQGQSTARSMELHADLLAGYYMGADKTSTVNIEHFARSLFEMGDLDFNHPQHHGTPDQRVESMARGYSLWRDGFDFVQSARMGADYVLSI